jgi:ubiquinone/menaquinone biosynthesis C-methylase UbiE
MTESAGRFSLHDPKTAILARVIREKALSPTRRLLVVGCGNGVEAATLATVLNCEVTGIDIDARFEPEAIQFARLQRGDALALEFANEFFDVVYSYHALEHMTNPRKAVSEMRRVLKKNGICCVGTPNRSRLVGYLGSKDATLSQKFQWNWNDWKARITGRFRNELGAHAGFTENELRNILESNFAEAEPVTVRYYRELYSTKRQVLDMLIGLGLSRLVFPSVYFVCR